jgi:hypothetical protein
MSLLPLGVAFSMEQSGWESPPERAWDLVVTVQPLAQVERLAAPPAGAAFYEIPLELGDALLVFPAETPLGGGPAVLAGHCSGVVRRREGGDVDVDGDGGVEWSVFDDGELVGPAAG